jgi:hypothetical protein
MNPERRGQAAGVAGGPARCANTGSPAQVQSVVRPPRTLGNPPSC